MTLFSRTSGFRGGICCFVLSALPLAQVIAGAPPDADRAAILAMQGEYRIGFSFTETVALAADYTRAEPYRTGGDEVVILAEDSPGRIVLQHLLLHVPSGHVTKHWRQDWEYEAPRRLEFAADQTWRWRTLTQDETEGRWTQCVYEVSDAPRYCGSGRWVHENGISTWTSDTSWRPLPRRDYTKREDYNALGAINRHTITALIASTHIIEPHSLPAPHSSALFFGDIQMTPIHLFIFALAILAIFLCLGLVGHVWDIEGIKITRLGLFLCTLMCLASGLTFWVERQERKERRGEGGRNPPDQ